MHYLISYAWRRKAGDGRWQLSNNVTERSPVEWILETREFPEEEYVLISSIEITDLEYLKLHRTF